jgi:hypothetical protein
MIIPDHFSESLATVFLGEIYLSSLTQTRIRDPNLLTIDPGTEMEKFKSRIWARRPGSTTLIFGIIYGSIRSRIHSSPDPLCPKPYESYGSGTMPKTSVVNLDLKVNVPPGSVSVII